MSGIDKVTLPSFADLVRSLGDNEEKGASLPPSFASLLNSNTGQKRSREPIPIAYDPNKRHKTGHTPGMSKKSAFSPILRSEIVTIFDPVTADTVHALPVSASEGANSGFLTPQRTPPSFPMSGSLNINDNEVVAQNPFTKEQAISIHKEFKSNIIQFTKNNSVSIPTVCKAVGGYASATTLSMLQTIAYCKHDGYYNDRGNKIPNQALLDMQKINNKFKENLVNLKELPATPPVPRVTSAGSYGRIRMPVKHPFNEDEIATIHQEFKDNINQYEINTKQHGSFTSKESMFRNLSTLLEPSESTLRSVYHSSENGKYHSLRVMSSDMLLSFKNANSTLLQINAAFNQP